MTNDNYPEFENLVNRKEYGRAYHLLLSDPSLLVKIASNGPEKVSESWAKFYEDIAYHYCYGNGERKSRASALVNLTKRNNLSEDFIRTMEEKSLHYVVLAMN